MKLMIKVVRVICIVLYFTNSTNKFKAVDAIDPFHTIKTEDLQHLQDEIAETWQIDYHKKISEATFRSILTNLTVMDTLGRNLIRDFTICEVCKQVIHKVQEKHPVLPTVGRAICELYMNLMTGKHTTFCADVIDNFLPIITYIVDNSEILDPEYACSLFLQNKVCYYKKAPLNWEIEITPKSLKQLPQVDSKPNAKPLKILHITDLHISSDYEVGADNNCKFPVCCKRGLGSPNPEGKAGKWGDYACDIPPWLFTNTLLYINHTHRDIDLVYFTGDIVDHSVWRVSKSEHSKAYNFVYKFFYESFPNITVLAQIGNHETTPINSFTPRDPKIEQSGHSSQWLYNLMADLWKYWLPSDALVTVQRQGYYSFNVNDKFKIISLNNNVCYNLNWWLLLNTTFLIEQLTFLRDELEDSERNSQFVHILTHIPPGNNECIEPWEKSYNRLIKRFAHIVKGQFFGHTHIDELKIFYDGRDPINVGYNGASLTTYQKYNPNYKIMTVDSNTYEILDIDTYTFNLTHANLYSQISPRWFKLYSMKKAYGLPNFSPQVFDCLVDRMNHDYRLAYLYWRLSVRDADPSLKDGCDRNCINKMLCKIVTTEINVTNKDYCK